MDSFPFDNSPLVGGEMHALVDNHTGRLLHKWRHYLDVYDRELSDFRHGYVEGHTRRPLRFLEIGVSEGGSLLLWRSWFGSDATIFGVDIDPTSADLVDPDVAQVRIGSQDDPDFLRSVVADMGGVDIVLDDGSHMADHQRISYETLWPLLTPGGRYLVEDVHTAYWADFGGGLRRPGTAVEDAKARIDDMHRWYYRERGSQALLEPDHPDVWSVRFYDSIIVVEKRLAGTLRKPHQFIRGDEIRPTGHWADRQALYGNG